MMTPRRAACLALIAACCLLPTARCWAGLYYSGETVAELPSQWRGFLLDQRLLRNIAVRPSGKLAASPVRLRYEEAAAKLEKTARERKLTADEAADLGALYVRLGEAGKAVELLRSAQREHPSHFHLVANLGTAWQLQGDLDQAAACLEQAVRLAPGKLQKAEEYHLKLVRLRQREPRGAQGLDNLFGVRYVGDKDRYEPGKLAEAELKKLPAEAVTHVQQLALWLPADGRLLWQLAELANAHGDVKTAAAIMDGCVSEFALRAPELREHRQATRAAADAEARAANAEHSRLVAGLAPRSTRPLLKRFDEELPPIKADGVNGLPWTMLAETTISRDFHPTFANYLKELDGKEVTLTGYMQPLGQDIECTSFMLIEYPIGCWYCEMPDITGILMVELPAGRTQAFTRDRLRIEGRLTLNSRDPEDFLYTIRQAKVTAAE